MIDWTIYGWCVLGIIVSVLLPVLWEAVYRYFPGSGPKALPPTLGALWAAALPYVVLGLASALTAILIVAFLRTQLAGHPDAALLAGYAWDSTLQKLRKPS